MNSEMERAEQLVKSIWPGIHLEKRLGRGAYGCVYECVKTDAAANFTTREALKIIHMPFDDIESLAEEVGTTPESYYQNQKKQAIDEIKIMDQLKSPHIVHINDYAIIEEENLSGFYILIRMDVLTSLTVVMKKHLDDTQSEAEALAKKVALDICDALILCQKKNVVHRDIKPQNVFISDNGEFYLGDFGVAKSLSGLISTLSYKGTEQFIAPEVALGQYDHRVDLYSLGLLLYQILNHRRMPFCPSYPKPQSAEDGQLAYYKRVRDKMPVPAPDNCSPAFAKIVQKLCQYNPNDRYHSAKELKEALLALNDTDTTQKKTAKEKPTNHQKSAENTKKSSENTVPFTGNPKQDSKAAKSGSGSPSRPADSSGAAPKPVSSTDASGHPVAPTNGSRVPSGSTAMPKGFSQPMPKPEKIPPKPDKLRMPTWALASIMTVVVIVGAMILGKTVFAPKDSGNESQIGTENSLAANDDPHEESDSNNSSEDDSQPQKTSDAPDKVKLTSQNFVAHEGAEIKKDVLNSLGQSFKEAVFVHGWYVSSYVRFYVRDYERLIGNFSCPDEMVESDDSFTLSIYLDDNAESPLQTLDMSRTIPSTPLDLDVSGADFITFQMENTSGDVNGLLLTDCFLYSDGSQVDVADTQGTADNQTQKSSDTPDKVKLTSQNFVAHEGAEIKKDVLNSLGQSFKEAISVHGWYIPSYVRFYVRDYERLVGNFSCPDEMVESDDSFTLSIYLDDNMESPIQTLDMSRTIPSTPLDIDVSGADFITFYMENTSGDVNGLLLTDCYLTK